MILWGSVLKNTSFVIGITCYVGHNTKIMKNSIKNWKKVSLLEHQMN